MEAAVTQQLGLAPRHHCHSPPLPSTMLMSAHNCVLMFSRTHNGFQSQQPKQTFVNLYASGHMKEAGLLSLCCASLGFNSALWNINPARWNEWQRAPPLKVVSHVIIIIYKTHSGSVALPAFPSLWPCTLQSIFARNPELLRVSMVARASITWNIQGAQRLPWGPAQGFYSDLIIRHDFFMSYDSPVELESALNPCDSHGNWEGGGGGEWRGGAASALPSLYR